jgi:arsenate reductase
VEDVVNTGIMFNTIDELIKMVKFDTILKERRLELETLVTYIQSKKDKALPINLNFICTHNSRRSQFTQVWASVAACKYGIAINSYSGGVEVTACDKRTIESLQRLGFKVESVGDVNPVYTITYSYTEEPIITFSKLFDDTINPTTNFAAIMTCSHADENCPVVTGCDQRIAVRYNDPKVFDDSVLETAMYDSRSYEIATEMLYVFSKIKN